jgi:hypothetical protein
MNGPTTHGNRILGGVAATFLILSCQTNEGHNLPNDVVWNSTHFAYHSRSGDGYVCQDIVAKLEQHFSSIQAALGFDWPKGRVIHYHKFETQEDFAVNSPCPGGSAACTDRDDVYSYRVFEQHELIHAYLWPIGLPPPVITEGAAVALVCNQAISSTPSLSLLDAMRVRDALADQRVYDTGGRLVRYLLTTYGAELFLRFYSILHTTSSFEDLDRAMLTVFGNGAEDIWTATLASVVSCPPAFECSRSPLPLDGSPTSIFPTCGLLSDVRTFDLAATADIAIAGPSFLSVASCDSIAFSKVTVTSDNAGAQLGLVTLPKGHYYVDIRTAEPTIVRMSTDVTPWAGVDCSALQPLLLATGAQQDLRISVPPDEPIWIVKVSFQDPRQLTVRLPSRTTLSACPDCSSSRCETYSVRSQVSWQGNYVLRIQGEDVSKTTAIDILGR